MATYFKASTCQAIGCDNIHHNRKFCCKECMYKSRPPMSDEQKRRLSEALKGRKLSEEQRKKLSISSTGKKMSVEARRKMSIKQTGKNNNLYGKHHSLETRMKMSKTKKGKIFSKEHRQKLSDARSNYISSREFKPFSGLKGQWYESKTNGKMYLHSSWEVEFARYLDKLDISWERPNKSFKYEYDGIQRNYYPDFYLNDLDKWIEIKGFVTDKDKAKWKDFPYDLIVLGQEELSYLNII